MTVPGPLGPSWDDRFGKYREDLLKIVIVGIPIWVLNRAVGAVGGALTVQPWRILFVLLPLGALAWVLWRRVAVRDLALGSRMVMFLGLYVSIFVLALDSRLLDWQRTLIGYDDVTPSSPLGLGKLGDWRYRLVHREPAQSIAVVLMDSTDIEEGRTDLMRLLAIASAQGVRGVALDFHFDTPSPVDGAFCRTLDRAGLAVVLAGFGVSGAGGATSHVPYPSSLDACIPDESRGHLVVFRERDMRVRSLPLHTLGDRRTGYSALSLLAAERLADGEVGIPASGLLQFIPPDSLLVIPFSRVAELAPLMSGRLLLVGEIAGADRFATADGEVPGVYLHAWALHSLLTGHFIERAPTWISVIVLLLGCYGLLVLARVAAPVKALAGLAAALSATTVAGAVAAITFWRTWVDMAYPLAAWWLFLLLLLPVRRRLAFPGDRPQEGTSQSAGTST